MMRRRIAELINLIKSISSVQYLTMILTSIFSLTVYLFVTRTFKLENSLEIKDLLGLLFNLFFVILISTSLTKSYDNNRKKKDIYIDELRIYLSKINNFYLELRGSDFARSSAFNGITELRDEANNFKSLLEDGFSKPFSTNFDLIQNNFRATDRLINPSDNYSTNISVEQVTLINQNRLKIVSEIMIIITTINEI